MKKVFYLFLATLMLTGCNPSNNSVDNELELLQPLIDQVGQTPAEKDSWEYLLGEDGKPKEEITITWFVNDPTFAWNSYGSDVVSRVIKEKTGINIRWSVPADDSGTKLASLISGDMLPDIVSVQSWYNQVHQLANQNYLYSLDTLIEYFAPSFKERQQDDIWNYFKEGDGKTYGVPNFAYSTEYISDDEKLEPNGAILVRKDWYEEAYKAGYDMTTPDSFIDGCKYIAEKHPSAIPFQLSPFNSNGSASIDWLEQYFNCEFEDENGNYVDTRTTENYKDLMKFLNECTSEGIILPENFSAKSDTVQKNIARGNVFVSAVTPQDYQIAFMTCFDKGIEYIPLVLRNYKGEAPVLQDISGNGYLLNMISRKCKRPDIVIKLFDFLYSEEGQRLVAFGIEGETYIWNEDKTKILWTDRYVSGISGNNLEDQAWVNSYGLYQMTLFMNLAYINKLKPLNGRRASDVYIDNLKRPLIPYSYNFKPTFLKHDTSADDYFTISTNAKKIDSKWVTYVIEIMRSDDYLKQYDESIKFIKRFKFDDVLEFYKESYVTTKKLLNIEFGYPTNKEGYKEPVTGPNGDFSFWRD